VEAERFYREALSADRSMAQIWVQLGHACKEQGKFGEAEEAYRNGTDLDPNSSDAFLQLGHLLKILDRKADAEDNYARAHSLDPGNRDSHRELVALGWSRTRLNRIRRRQVDAGEITGQVVVELSDLLDFLQHSKFPTGIQRVQLVLAEAIGELTDERAASFAAYDTFRNKWFPILRSQVQEIIDLVDEASLLSDEARSARASRLRASILDAGEYEFTSRSILINPGTSWGFLNYFLALRDARNRYGLRYVPFIHDCIPLIFPEHCNPNLITDFIFFINRMLTSADLILVNSENTRADVAKAAAELDLPLPPCVTVPLNGHFQSAARSDAESADAFTLLRENNLDMREFVLFVSTIEPRKNHALALSVWSKMIKSGRQVPVLVCVGGAGWYNEAFHRLLDRDTDLAERVLVLTDISDQLLSLLYKRCLFTIYPSFYEGWGLPVSESIAYGKVPLVSRVASLPEAGGDLAEYFELASEVDFQAKLERLIDDVPYRKERELKISGVSNLRNWADIARQILEVLSSLEKRPYEPSGPAVLRVGRYYSFARNAAKRLADLCYSAEAFRDGLAWHLPEDFGCWASSPVDIVFSLIGEMDDEFALYLHLVGSPNQNLITLSVPGANWAKKISPKPGAEFWERLSVRLSSNAARHEIRLRIASESLANLGLVSDGKDQRLVSLGLKGIYACGSADLDSRIKIIEAITSGDTAQISRRWPKDIIL
jgi:glycosyltransferase involved in cell wall biosynthesis